jgi:hypothetical protein
MLAAALAGTLAGLLHVFSGADHLAAIAPFGLQARARAWVLGLKWGLGHASGVLLVAGLAWMGREALDLDAVGTWGERAVGASLILIGLWGLRSLFRHQLHAHPHGHDGNAHLHFHAHAPGAEHGSHVHGHAALGVGLLHGLGGTAHLLGVLPGLALPNGAATAAYLAAFAAGSVLAMAAFAAALGRFAPRGLRPYRALLGLSAAACTLTGLAWLVR